MQTSSPCPSCGGSGEVVDKKANDTDAQGLKSTEETVSIKIPAGVMDGMQLKVSGKGNEAPGNNGIAGDLLVLIEPSNEKEKISTLTYTSVCLKLY